MLLSHNSIVRKVKLDISRHWQLYCLVLPAIIALVLFSYVPMYGLQIAFRNYKPARGITGSEWVGLKFISQFVNSYQFGRLIGNTLALSAYSLTANFPLPIILALIINQLSNRKYKKTVQTITYLPHFISTVVLVGMLNVFLSSSTGLYGHLMRALGNENPVSLVSSPDWFRTIYVFSGIWQDIGWDSIIYLAALTAINPELHEAAAIDGASKMQRIWHIDIPELIPTAIILLILRIGSLMNVGYEKVFLMQNQLNQSVSEIVSTYVYKIGLESSQYSYSAAIGLFNTLINFVLLVASNTIARKAGYGGIW